MNPFVMIIGVAILILGTYALFDLFDIRRTHKKDLQARLRDLKLPTQEAVTLSLLTREVPDVSPSDLLEQRWLYNEAVVEFLFRLRRSQVSENSFQDALASLRRLRRIVHPPETPPRYITSTRELIEGYKTSVSTTATEPRKGELWKVDEDKILFLTAVGQDVLGFREAELVTVDLTMPDHGVYRFSSQIRTILDKPRPGLELEHTDQAEFLNQREYLREDAQVDILVRAGGTRKGAPAFCKDLSGGGLAFSTTAEFTVGQDLLVTLPEEVFDGDSLARTHPARILRIHGAPEEGTSPAHKDSEPAQLKLIPKTYYCRWERLNERIRDQVIGFVAELHRRRIKRH